MKKQLLSCLVLVSIWVSAQNVPDTASVEKNIFGFQLGLVNFSFQNETLLQSQVALHTELGLDLVTAVLKSTTPDVKDRTTTIIAPYISLEPRWYYNIAKRFPKDKNIKNNSANYLSIKTLYQANDSPVIKNGDSNIVPQFSILPKFGIRRSFAKQFNYEFSGGVGYQYNIFSDTVSCDCNHNTTAVDIQARIGYTF